LVIATVDPALLPETATWYLVTTLPAREADLSEIVRLYGLRNWVEQQYKQVKASLGWSQYQVRSDRAMRRHWALVQGAIAFCWWAETHAPAPAPPPTEADHATNPPGERGGKGAVQGARVAATVALLAHGAAAGAGLVGASALPVALLARVERPAAARGVASPLGLAPPGPSPQPL
jgi:hypothetical protein